MKNIFPLLKLTGVTLVLLAVIYPLAMLGIAQLAPNQGKGETVVRNGKSVGYSRIGQEFTKTNYFWGRPSAVGYNAAGSGGSNKAPSNADYLALVQKRIDTFLIAHPDVKRSEIPSDMVTASGSGLDPNISVEGAKVQIGRIAKARNLSQSTILKLVDNQIETALLGPKKINVLQLNLALDQIK